MRMWWIKIWTGQGYEMVEMEKVKLRSERVIFKPIAPVRWEFDSPMRPWGDSIQIAAQLEN